MRPPLTVAEAPDHGLPFGLRRRGISTRDLAELIAGAVGYTAEIMWDTTKPNGQPRGKLDVSRTQGCFGFEARVLFDDGIRPTVEWREANRGGLDQGSARVTGA